MCLCMLAVSQSREDKHRAAEQRAAKIAKRRADFNATNS